jgi:hypothetical protein
MICLSPDSIFLGSEVLGSDLEGSSLEGLDSEMLRDGEEEFEEGRCEG